VPLLTLLVLVPLAGAALISVIGREREALIHRVAFAVSLGVLAGLFASWTLLRRDVVALLRR